IPRVAPVTIRTLPSSRLISIAHLDDRPPISAARTRANTESATSRVPVWSRWQREENPDGTPDRDNAGHRRRRDRPGRRVGAAGRRPRRVLVRASGEIQRAGAGPQDLLGDRGTVRMELQDVKRFSSGVVLLTYLPAS